MRWGPHDGVSAPSPLLHAGRRERQAICDQEVAPRLSASSVMLGFQRPEPRGVSLSFKASGALWCSRTKGLTPSLFSDDRISVWKTHRIDGKTTTNRKTTENRWQTVAGHKTNKPVASPDQTQ